MGALAQERRIKTMCECITGTPRPWVILPVEDDKDYIRIRGTQLGGQYKIANVLFVRIPGNSQMTRNNIEIAQANARTIINALERRDEAYRLHKKGK